MERFTARCATGQRYRLAEGPVWDGVGKRVLWVDIAAGVVHVGTLRDGTVVPSGVHHVDTTVGAVAVAEDGALLVAGHQGVHLLSASGLATLLVTTAIDDLSPEQLSAHPGSGALFTADVDACGLLTNTWREGTP